MADDFDAVVETSIVLAVDTLFIRVGNLTDFFCVIVSFSAFVDFQFHSHKQRTRTVEDRFRFVVIVVDVFLAEFVVAVIAVGVIAIVKIMCVVVVDEKSAVGTVAVIVFVAVVAERQHTVSFRFRTPDTIKTAVADGGKFLEAIVTHEVVIKFVHGVLGEFCSAVEAGELFRHGFVLLKCSLFGFCTAEIIYK
jgi:hypothetical protein